MTPDHRERLVTCWHEASHACIHVLHYKDQVHSLALDAGGYAGVTKAFIRRSTSNPVKAAICCLAGPAAEFLITGKLSRDNVGIDLDHAKSHLRGTGLCLDDVWPKTLSLVRHYEPEIGIIADELLRRGRLSGLDIDRLVCGGWEAPRWT
jgi:hypothetical protein